MNWLKRLTGTFNTPVAIEQPVGHIAQHGTTMCTRSFIIQQQFSLDTMLGGDAKTAVHWQASAHPEKSGLWALRQIETCGDIRSEGQARLMSFDEALNTMALMEAHQSTYHGHASSNTHKILGATSFIHVAEKEGYVQNTDGYMVKRTADDAGGSFSMNAIERARQTLEAEIELQQGVFSQIFSNTQTGQKSLAQVAQALRNVALVKEKILMPFEQANIEATYIGFDYKGVESIKHTFKDISRAHSNIQDYIQQNPDGIFNTRDQKEMRQLFTVLELETFTDLARGLYKQISEKPSTKHADLLLELNSDIRKLSEKCMPGIPDHLHARIEAAIMSEAKNRHSLCTRVQLRLEHWMQDAAKQAAAPTTLSSPKITTIAQGLLPRAAS